MLSVSRRTRWMTSFAHFVHFSTWIHVSSTMTQKAALACGWRRTFPAAQSSQTHRRRVTFTIMRKASYRMVFCGRNLLSVQRNVKCGQVVRELFCWKFIVHWANVSYKERVHLNCSILRTRLRGANDGLAQCFAPRLARGSTNLSVYGSRLGSIPWHLGGRLAKTVEAVCVYEAMQPKRTMCRSTTINCSCTQLIQAEASLHFLCHCTESKSVLLAFTYAASRCGMIMTYSVHCIQWITILKTLDEVLCYCRAAVDRTLWTQLPQP